MNKALLAVAFCSLSCATSVFAADPQLEMMKKFEEAATPGAAHKRLAALAGSWAYTSKMWESPDAKPMQSKGKSSMKMILGGRWLQQDFKGEAMGKPFNGLGLIGYDNVKGSYETVWLDTMSTGLTQGTGSYDEAAKTLKDSGSHSCPISADKKQDYRSEWNMIDKNHMVYSMYGKGFVGDKEFKMMEISYTRAK